MAATVRLTIAPIGAFGAEVIGLLPEGTGVVPADPAEVALAAVPPGSAIALVSPVPVPRIERALSHAAYLWKSRFLPVVVDQGRLRVGPVSAPGTTGCSECFRARSRQHLPSTGPQDAVEAALQNDPRRLVEGHLPMAAAIASAALRSFTEHDAPAPGAVGEIRLYDLLGQTMLRSDVVGVHACRICAPKHDWPERSTSRLTPFVEALATGSHAECVSARGDR